jgi:hypothetical protein
MPFHTSVEGFDDPSRLKRRNIHLFFNFKCCFVRKASKAFRYQWPALVLFNETLIANEILYGESSTGQFSEWV